MGPKRTWQSGKGFMVVANLGTQRQRRIAVVRFIHGAINYSIAHRNAIPLTTLDWERNDLLTHWGGVNHEKRPPAQVRKPNERHP